MLMDIYSNNESFHFSTYIDYYVAFHMSIKKINKKMFYALWLLPRFRGILDCLTA